MTITQSVIITQILQFRKQSSIVMLNNFKNLFVFLIMRRRCRITVLQVRTNKFSKMCISRQMMVRLIIPSNRFAFEYAEAQFSHHQIISNNHFKILLRLFSITKFSAIDLVFGMNIHPYTLHFSTLNAIPIMRTIRKFLFSCCISLLVLGNKTDGHDVYGRNMPVTNNYLFSLSGR